MTDAVSQPSTSQPVETSSPTTTPTPSVTPGSETTPTLVNTPAPQEFVPLEATAFTMPEGFNLDAESMTSFLGIMNNRELSPQQQAQALIELQAGLTTKSSEAGSQAWKDQMQKWQSDVENDATLGGANLPTTLANVGRVMDKFADAEIRAAFDQTGAGNHPAIVRFLNALGMQFGEATPTPPGNPAATGNKTLADRIFGNSSNKTS